MGWRLKGEGPDPGTGPGWGPRPCMTGRWSGVGAARWGARGAHPYQERLEEPEGADQPDVQVGMHLRGRAVEGVGHHQEGVVPHGEELPVVGARGGDGLVGLEQARPRVPLVDDAVDVVVVSWKSSCCVEGGEADFRGLTAALAEPQPALDPVPGPPRACPVRPGLGPIWTWPCSPHTLLPPLTLQR